MTSADVEELIDVEDDLSQIVPRSETGARGTILVTLRNVPPYTEWYVLTSIEIYLKQLPDQPFPSGTSLFLPKSHLPQRDARSPATPCSAPSALCETHGQATHIV